MCARNARSPIAARPKRRPQPHRLPNPLDERRRRRSRRHRSPKRQVHVAGVAGAAAAEAVGRSLRSEAPAEVEPVTETAEEPAVEFEHAPQIQATEAPVAQPAPRERQAPAAFVLPGESLSKYGGAPAPETEKPAQQQFAPSRPASTFKPSTLVEAPIQWDGSGVLPGESISRHRSRRSEPAGNENAESPTESSAAPESGSAQNEVVEEFEESAPQLGETETAESETASPEAAADRI